MKIEYLDDIMSKANYALMEKEINFNEWVTIIHNIISIVRNKTRGNKNVA